MSEAQTVADLTRASTAPTKLDTLEVYAFPTADGIKIVDARAYGDSPARKQGTRYVHTADSFVDYTAEQHTEGTKVWVDDTRFTAVAVINDHDAFPGYGDHRLVLQLKPTESWLAWAKHDGELLDQTVFAELIEDNAPDVVEPAASVMLELAQSFQAHTKVDFESSKYLANGVRSLEYKETVDAKAGRRGEIQIPAEFQLGLSPFVGTDPYRVIARFRYRIVNGHLQIGYKLNRPAEVQRSAFGDIVDAIGTGLKDRASDVIILAGTPS